MVREIKNFEEFKAVIAEDKITIVDFHAQWCGPCKVIAPQFENMSVEMSEHNFVKVDVDAVPEAAEFAEVKAMPTFKFYKNGAAIKEVVGANINLVKKKINDIISETA